MPERLKIGVTVGGDINEVERLEWTSATTAAFTTSTGPHIAPRPLRAVRFQSSSPGGPRPSDGRRWLETAGCRISSPPAAYAESVRRITELGRKAERDLSGFLNRLLDEVGTRPG